jgi:hypothetical protein
MRPSIAISSYALSLLCFGLAADPASAQTRVFGSASLHYQNGTLEGGTYFRHVAVNAWLDNDNVAHGTMAWEGDTDLRPHGGGRPTYVGGLSDPFLLEVVDIIFDGNSAIVIGTVIHAPNNVDIGGTAEFIFTDNTATDDPDLINGMPIDAGHISVQ